MPKTYGNGVEVELDGDILVIRIDTAKTYGRSKSGKSTIIASTGGNKTIDTPHGAVKLGLNCYR